MMKNSRVNQRRNHAARLWLAVALGVLGFLGWHFAHALVALNAQSGGMANRFSKLAQDKYVAFLVWENVKALSAYGVLWVVVVLMVEPWVELWTGRSRWRGWLAVAARALFLTVLLHGIFVLRLVETRPYFLKSADLGHWYYRILEVIPESWRVVAFPLLFTGLPLSLLAFALWWHLRRLGGERFALVTVLFLLFGGVGWSILTRFREPAAVALGGDAAERRLNVIIIGSDSLRGDRIGAAGYRPDRGPGVSPAIDALAARSVRFAQCYTPIASTLESGISLMTSTYPHTHGVRQMYPAQETVEHMRDVSQPIAGLLEPLGYDTAALGDWCAGYYEVTPLGFETISVSSFDNFKIYMSQAVLMSHHLIPMYFDNPLGFQMFPQLGSFAQVVTPDLVTKRVEKRLAAVARSGQPFFWHVFYSCNHLPYRIGEPYRSMFTDPKYHGENRNGVNFDIDRFIGGTDLEDKWSVMPEDEIRQLRALYDGCTRQFDDCVKRILDSLRVNGLDGNTVVVVTSDHGDDLYEPGVTLGHGLTLNGGLQANHIPMVVHVPGQAAAVIPETVRSIDLAPTLAELIGLEAPVGWEGRSFAPWLNDPSVAEARPFYAETGFPFIQFRVPGVERPELPPMDQMTFIDESFNYQFVLKPGYQEQLVAAKQRCLRTQNWKILCTPTRAGGRHFSLFCMNRDPHAEDDLAGERPEVLEPLRVALERWMDEHQETPIQEIFPAGEPAE